MTSTQCISSYGVNNVWSNALGGFMANRKKEVGKFFDTFVSYNHGEKVRQNPSCECMNPVVMTYNGTILREGGVVVPVLSESIETLTSFLELKEGWNGHGASPFSSKHIDRCKDFLQKLVHQPDVFPTACKSIQFEYELENGRYLEFEVYESGDIKRYYESETGEERTDFFVYPGDIEEINKEIVSFYA